MKHYSHGTGHLRVVIAPVHGPVGTTVRIRATGCGDAAGLNHAVSFNPGFGSTQQSAWAHYRFARVRSRLTGQTLTAVYVITRQDAAAAAHADPGLPTPEFTAQCSDDLASARFEITNR